MPQLGLDHVCFLIIIVCCSFIGPCQSQSLSVLGQKTIRSFAPYSVTITNTLQKNVRLQVQLNGNDQIQTKEINVKRETEERVVFETKNITIDEYMLAINSLDPSFSFSENIELISDDKLFSIFIQIDKPIYKPGDMMHFRVIVVDSNTRPVTNPSHVEVSVTDSKDITIRVWQSAKLHNGVFESSVQLPSSPNMGLWQLNVGTGEFQVEKSTQFEVKPYVLPKFWIKVYPTEVPILEKKLIKLTVESAFTFGRPVTGVAKVDLYLEEYVMKPDYTGIKTFEGIKTFQFDLKNEVAMIDDVYDVIVNVTVTEAHTNTTLSIHETIRVYRYEYDIALIKQSSNFRPGVPFPLQISFKDKKGNAVGSGQSVTIQISYSTSEDNLDTEVTGTINNQGLIVLTKIEPPQSAMSMTVKLKYQSVEFEEEIECEKSQSNEYLRIILPQKYNKLYPNKEVQFEIYCSAKMTFLTYLIVARGVIVDSHLVKTNRKKKFVLKYRLKPILAPRARIIVFYTNREFLIWDELMLNFETFENNFKFSLDENKYNPGQEAYISVGATSDSYVAFHAIDQSVLLLNSGWNNLTKTNIIKEFDSFDTDDSQYDPFHSMGLFVRTTSKPDIASSKLVRYGIGGFLNARQVIHIRTVFPETWLWQNVSMNGNQILKFSAQVPDTITSWFVTGFALSPTTGLGIINEPVTFNVEKTFYIVAHLPYSIKRGEVTVIQVMIYNFLQNTLITDVYLYNKNDEIEFVDQSTDDKTRRKKVVIMPGNSGKQVTFLIQAKKIGEIAVKIEALNNLKQDSIEHILRVEPESHLIEKNELRYIEHEKHMNTNETIQIDIPRKAIEGSVAIEFGLDPNFLRIPIENVQDLIQIPKENGEANTMDFVPHVIALEYLTESKSTETVLKSKLINFIRKGYYNQMNYKLNDGSFGVWKSEKNKKGNIFITSLVARSFKMAAKHVEGLVSIETVEAALSWLASKQNADGSFKEVGDQINNELQGGYRPSSYALTAYVLSAFLEIGELASKYKPNMALAVAYLVDNHSKMDVLYDLALTGYALSLEKHEAGKKILDKVMQESIYDRTTNSRYWDEGPVSVEIASYTVLTYAQYNPIIEAKSVLIWINKHRTSTGGLSSIQNTCIGLRAMAQFALKTSVDSYDYTINLRWKQLLGQKFRIDKHVAHYNFSTMIPSDVRQVLVETNGLGLGLYQVAYQYRVELTDAKHGFDLEVKLMNESSYHVQNLQVCTKYLKPEQYTQSNLAYVEVFFPSGLHVNDESAIKESPGGNQIKQIELLNRGTNVRVYYNSLGDFYSCFKVTAERRYAVALHRSAYVIVYDSVDRNRFAIKKYDGIDNQPCNICQEEDCKTMGCDDIDK